MDTFKSNVIKGTESQSSSRTDLSSNQFKDSICDVVKFSICSLSSIKLRLIYPEVYHASFRENHIKQMVEHFDLPDKVLSPMSEFTLEDEFTFLSSIKQNLACGPLKLVEELVLLSLKSGTYDARAHYLNIEVAESLGVPRDLIEIHCESVYDQLLKARSAQLEDETDLESESYKKKRDTKKKIKKYFAIGLASIGGGAVIGVTGGLAAPIVASAFAGVLGAGTVVMSSVATGVVGSLFGVAGAGLTASKMNKRIGDLEEFAFQSLNPDCDQTSLTITIAISGWIADESPQQFAKPWKYLRHTKEQYCLCYESKYLLELSRAMDYLLSFVVSYATQEALKYTFLASVMAAIAWPTALISMANIIDNPWDCCIGRSAEAGKHLADVLMTRQQGRRPASLIGFSLGARVIFFCLQELAQRKDSEGMIGDVVLLGAPVTASPDQWRPLRRIVSGRIINGYSSSDWLLKFLYRTSSAAIRVAGLQPLTLDSGAEPASDSSAARRKQPAESKTKADRDMVKNVDLTPLVSGHMDYYKKLTEILDYVKIRTAASAPADLSLQVLAGAGRSGSVLTPVDGNSSQATSGLGITLSSSATEVSITSLTNRRSFSMSTLAAWRVDGIEQREDERRSPGAIVVGQPEMSNVKLDAASSLPAAARRSPSSFPDGRCHPTGIMASQLAQASLHTSTPTGSGVANGSQLSSYTPTVARYRSRSI